MIALNTYFRSLNTTLKKKQVIVKIMPVVASKSTITIIGSRIDLSFGIGIPSDGTPSANYMDYLLT